MGRRSNFIKPIFWAQMLATLLVVMGHSYPFVTAVPGWLQSIQLFIYAFHMPLFVFISGYLVVFTRQSQRFALGAFAKKRFLKLLIPYFALSCIALFPKYLCQPFLNDELSLTFDTIVRVFLVPRENIWGHFWFLPMIFLLGLVGWLLDKAFDSLRISYGKGWTAAAILLFGIYYFTFRKSVCGWFSIDDIFSFGWIFAVGALSASHGLIDRLSSDCRGLWALIAAPFVLAVVLFALEVPQMLLPLKYAAIALVMTLSMLRLSGWLARLIDIDTDAAYAQTFAIFILSWPFQAVVNVVVERVLMAPYYVVIPLQLAVGIVAPILTIIIINKVERSLNMRWISSIIGK